MHREKERRKLGLPPLIGIQYGMRNAVADDNLPVGNTETGSDSPESETEASEDTDSAETGLASEEPGDYRRQRIIARVERFRGAQLMTIQEFRIRIGSSAFERWRGFVDSDANESWKHGTPQMFEKIAQVLGIGSAELLQ